MPDVLVWSFNKIKKEVVIDKDIQINEITADKNITFRWKLLSGDDILEKMQIKKDDNNWQTISKNTAFKWENISKGLHTFKVRAIDNKDNYSNEIEWSFNKLDTIQITKKHSEPNGKTNKTNILFEWKVNNGALKYNEIRKDNGDWESIGVDIFYKWNNISEEHHTFEVKATDTLNEESNILKWDFEVIESVSIELPHPITFDNINNDKTNNTSFETSWCISKSSNIFNLIDKFEAKIDGLVNNNTNDWDSKYISKLQKDGSWIDEDGTIHKSESTEECWMFLIPSLSPGEHSIEIRVVDIFGISHMLYSKVFTIIDSININKITEMKRQKIIEDSQIFSWVLNKGTLDYYEIKKDSNDWEKNSKATYTWSNIDKSLHTFKVRATDVLGNKSNTIEWNFERVDNISISKLDDKPNSKTNEKSLNFKWKLNNGVLDYYKIQKDSESWEKVNNTTYTWDNIPSGHRSFNVYAVDTMGNRSDTLKWDFEVIEGLEIEKNANVSGDILKNSIDFKWKITKGSDSLDRIKIQKDNTGIWEDIGVKATYTWNDITTKGDHSFKVKGLDIFNNESNIIEWTFTKPDIVQLEKSNNPSTNIKQDDYTFKWTVLGSEDKIKRYEVKKNNGSWEWVSDGLNQYKWETIPKGKNTLEAKAVLNDGNESKNILKWEFYNGTRLKWKYGSSSTPYPTKKFSIKIYEESYETSSFSESFYYCTLPKSTNPTLFDLKNASNKTTKSLHVDIGYNYGDDLYGYVWGYDNDNRITNILQIDHQKYIYNPYSAWKYSGYNTNDYMPPTESDNIKLEKTNDPKTDIGQDSYTFTWDITNNASKLKRYEVKLNNGAWEWYEDTSNTYTWNNMRKGKNILEIKAIANDGSDSNILKWEFYNGIGLSYRYGTANGTTATSFIVYEESYFSEPFITSIFYAEFDKTITPTMDELNNNKSIKTLNKAFTYKNSNKYGYIWGYDENNRITNILRTDLSVYISGYYSAKWSDKIYNSYDPSTS